MSFGVWMLPRSSTSTPRSLFRSTPAIALIDMPRSRATIEEAKLT